MHVASNDLYPEVKKTEISDVFNEFMHAFEMFKESNDQRLAEMEKKLSADILIKEKVDRISTFLDEQKSTLDALTLKNLRPNLNKSAFSNNQHQMAFDTYIRTGKESDLSLKSSRSVLNGDTSQGAEFFFPEIMEHAINENLQKLSSIRSIATVKKISSKTLKKIIVTDNAQNGMGWVDGTRIEQTEPPKFQSLSFETFEIFSMPYISQALLDDTAINIQEWLIAEVDKSFSDKEEEAFIQGDGQNKPLGFIKDSNLKNTKAVYQEIQDTKVFADCLIDLLYSIPDLYRQNATWVMNRKIQASIRKIKDNQGNYLWQPPAILGQNASLLGFRLVESEYMQDIDDTDSRIPIAFGDFARGFLVVDRKGIQILRDPYSFKPNVGFYITKRVGAGIQDPAAIRLLKVEK